MAPLKSLLGPDFELHDFDERGVPDNVDRQWRIEETKHWVDLGLQNIKNNITTLICGFARPSEIAGNESIEFILLDADHDTIKQRLAKRYQSPHSVAVIEKVSGKLLEKFIADNVYFSDILRKECEGHHTTIIDTNNLAPENVAEQIAALVK